MFAARIVPFKIAPLLTLALFASGCSSSGDLRSDYDKTANFASYTTYNFVDDPGPQQDSYQSMFTQYMITAITIEMEKRGYVKSQSPDLQVNFNGNLQDKTKVTQSASAAPMPYYGYRRGVYDPWGSYGYGTQTNVSQYTEGTFNIDLIDAKRKQLVWEAVSVGRVSDKDLENLQQGVQEGVPKFFAQYPFTAGSGTPASTDNQ